MTPEPGNGVRAIYEEPPLRVALLIIDKLL